MRAITWALRVALFVLLVAVAAKNTSPVTVRAFFEASWEMPLAAPAAGAFALGAALGVAACAGLLLRQRRAIGRLQRAVAGAEPGAARAAPAAPAPRPAEG